MKRREFLVRATIGGVSVPLLVRQLGCGKDTGVGPDGGGTEFPSLPAQGHTHTITISDADLVAGADKNYNSSTASGHSHTLGLNAADFTELNRGCPVIKVSGTADSHQHNWEIRYASKVIDITKTSSIDGGHSHDVTVDADDINSASTSRTYTTTSADIPSHTHEVTLSPADFQTLQDCGTVTVTSSQHVDLHTHTFSITPA